MDSPLIRGHEGIPLNLYRLSSPGIARVVSNERLTPAVCDDVRHIVLELWDFDYPFLEGQSLGVLPPAPTPQGSPQQLRLYSIASTRLGDDGSGRDRLALRQAGHLPGTARPPRNAGESLPITCATLEARWRGRHHRAGGQDFLLPDDPATNLILVATGTGIAPFPAFLRRIYLDESDPTGPPRRSTSIFGVRTAAECLYRDGPRTHTWMLRYSASPPPSAAEQATADGRRMYVHTRMAERIGATRELLERERDLPLHLRPQGDGGWNRGHP